MPKINHGCYKKIGYPSTVNLTSLAPPLTLQYVASGCTREVHHVQQMPNTVAKIMPSRNSQHWKEGYDQNETEHVVLLKLQEFSAAPRVLFYSDTVSFVNNWGQEDYMSVLIVTKIERLNVENGAVYIIQHQLLPSIMQR